MSQSWDDGIPVLEAEKPQGLLTSQRGGQLGVRPGLLSHGPWPQGTGQSWFSHLLSCVSHSKVRPRARTEAPKERDIHLSETACPTWRPRVKSN